VHDVPALVDARRNETSRAVAETSQRHLTGGSMRFTPPFDGTAALYLKVIADNAR